MGVYCTGGNEAANTLYKYFQVTMLQKRKKKNTFSFPTLEHLRVYVLSYIVTDMAHKTFAGYSPWDYEKVAILWRRSYRSMSPPYHVHRYPVLAAKFTKLQHFCLSKGFS